MEVKIDRNLCVACGACVSSCPAVFYIKDGLAAARPAPPEWQDDALSAAEDCPTAAISIVWDECP